MAEFLPLVKPGNSWTSTTSADVTGGQVLIASGVDTVGPGTADSLAYVGVAAFDALNGTSVTVYSPKIAVVTSSGAITAGSQVACAASGAVKSVAADPSTNARTVVGVALNTAASNKVKVFFLR